MASVLVVTLTPSRHSAWALTEDHQREVAMSKEKDNEKDKEKDPGHPPHPEHPPHPPHPQKPPKPRDVG